MHSIAYLEFLKFAPNCLDTCSARDNYLRLVNCFSKEKIYTLSVSINICIHNTSTIYNKPS